MPVNEYPRKDFKRAEIIQLLQIAAHMRCPGVNPDCCCRECSERVVLRVSTFVDPKTPDLQVPPCDQTMTCRCAQCDQDRASLVKIGPKDRRQPWELAA